jgi:hypothetical protein
MKHDMFFGMIKKMCKKSKKASKWEKKKMKECYWFVSIDELLLLILGISCFYFADLHTYRLYFIGLVILWYWFKIRLLERKIHKKRQKIYNIYYDNCQPIQLDLIEKKTEIDRKPEYYKLEQLETERKFIIDKFIVVNLIIVILIQLFIDTD